MTKKTNKQKKNREGFVQCNNVNNHLYEDSI